MKHSLLFLGLTLALATAGANAFELAKPQKFTIANGLTVYHLTESDLPLVSFRLIIPGAGNGAVSSDQEGLADLTAELLLKGTKNRNAAGVAEAVDFIGATLQVSARDEYVEMSGTVLSEHFPALLALAGECLLEPAFAADEVALEQGRRIDALKSIKDNPNRAVRYYFQKAWFGDHPLGRLGIGSEASLQAATPAMITAFYKSHYLPGKAVLAVVGDIQAGPLKTMLKSHLGKWRGDTGVVRPVALPPQPRRDRSRFLLIDKPDATQAYFILGTPGLAMGDPQAAVADVMNTLFGGRFTSWLNSELRVKRGLTYGARSSLQAWNGLGLYTISSYTRNEKIGEMLQVTMDLIAKARQEGFSTEEITSGRNYIAGQFPPSMEGQGAKARAYTDLHFYGLGGDYYSRYLDKIATAQPADAAAMASRLMPGEVVVMVVVGKAAEISTQLEKFGTFEVRDINQPGF